MLAETSKNVWRCLLLVEEIYDLVYAFIVCKQAPGKPVSETVLEMIRIMDNSYTWGNHTTMISSELHALLIDFEKGLKDKAPTPQVFTIQKGRDNKPKPQANKKVKGKGKADKNKQVVPYQPKPKPNL
ncbi:hypothetical protein Tco_0714313 [Tanacetum coccineum]